MINAKRPDGYIITQKTDILREDGILKVKLSPKILRLSGDISLEIVLFRDNSVVSTYPFKANITATIADIEDVMENMYTEDDDEGTIATWEYL